MLDFLRSYPPAVAETPDTKRRTGNRNREGIFLATALVVALSVASCGNQIGDSCQTSTDCDPNGNRVCDLSQPGGYCTILGCDETTCPSEAACIRTFPVQFLTRPCNPFCEDRHGLSVPDAGTDAGMSLDAGTLPLCPELYPQDAGGQLSGEAICPNGPTNDCTADEICLDSGLCAPRSTEVRYCELVCSSNSDCRAGYVCRPTGVEGSFLLSATPCAQTSFCAPATQ